MSKMNLKRRFFILFPAIILLFTSAALSKDLHPDFGIGFFALLDDNHKFLSNDGVVINEFMAKNNTYITDPDGEYDDWIELYNNSSEQIDLSGYYISDKADDPEKFQLPEGTIIKAGSYLIIWADEDQEQQGIHTNFKLSASGEELRLFTPELVMIQEVIFGEQEPDMSYSRIPNGTGEFVIKEPTFAENNETSISVRSSSLDSDIELSPNPVDEMLKISISGAYTMEIKIISMSGVPVFEGKMNGTKYIDCSKFAPGVYMVIAGKIVKKLIVM